MLIPVPEYPFVFKKATNEEAVKHPYAEDGSLKVLKLVIIFLFLEWLLLMVLNKHRPVFGV